MSGPSPVVVKLGGTTIVEELGVLREIVAEVQLRPVVVVHGGGKRLTEWLERLGVSSSFLGGRRITDEATLEVFLAVIGGLVNAELTAALRDLGGDAVGVHGIDGGLVHGPRTPGLGRVISEPTADAALLETLLAAGRLPVLAPMGLDEAGSICNVNADDAAAAVSAALGGDLVLLTDTDGVRGGDGRRIEELTPGDVQRLIEDGTIEGGMVPKVHSALRALAEGSRAQRAIIADGRVAGALHAALHGEGGTRFRPG